MSKIRSPFLIIFFIVILPLHIYANSQFKNFITVYGDKLFDGEKEFRFISFNIPNLHYVEDNLSFFETNSFRLPDDFEIRDALLSFRQMGGQVARIYTLSVRKQGEGNTRPVHVLGPGQFNEEAFKTLDKVLFYANELGIRLIIPFIDNWNWWGGVEDYAAFRDKTRDDFWIDEQLINDFKATIFYVLNRKNIYTGKLYKDDKAIFAWETGNELQCPSNWTGIIADYIKSLDKNHLIMDGYHSPILMDESLMQSNIDIVTTHHYPRIGQEMIDQAHVNREKTRGRKPYVIGEFGFVDSTYVHVFLDMIIENGTSGALLWSLRTHNRDGGFYWHSEPFGGDIFKAYHWPGFSSGNDYQEKEILSLMREKAFAIREMPVLKMRVPGPPFLFPVDDAAEISWQGSPGASAYDIERASSLLGKWTVIAKNLDDAMFPYQPLYSDKNVEIGKKYFYRVIAKNAAGKSRPSNRVKTKKIQYLTLVDEMYDSKQFFAYGGQLEFKTKNARRAKEDFHRLAGQKDAYIVYKVPRDIISFKLYTFFPDSVADIKLYVSDNGGDFDEIIPKRTDYINAAEVYDYFKPVLYESERLPNYSKLLKIECQVNTEIARVEIKYGK
ncbi:hypothetical protein JXQ31_15965 [candidate division KSB1 bacterium]|nr:hypothetical protein [candidate division KSB1 bacterium]